MKMNVLEKINNRKLIITVSIIFAIMAVVTTVIIVVLSHRETVGDVLELGDRYMSEMDYESAIREYRHAIEIDPKSEDAYIKLAEAYIALGDIDSAIKALEEGYEATQSERILERLNELRRELHTPENATKMTVATEPDKLTYFVGETLDLTGLTFTVTYDDGMTEKISEGYICDVITLEESGSVEITVTYGEIEATVNVIVYEDGKGGSGEKEPSTDPVTTEPTTTEPSTTEPTTTEPTTTEPTTTESTTTESTTTESTTTESTTTESTTTEAPVTSAPEPAVLTGISIKTQPTRTTYYVGDTLDTSGLALTAAYSDGRTETVTNGFTCSPTMLNTAGSQKITVTYGRKTATFNVTVTAVTLTSISIKTHPTKTTYNVGDTLDTSGLALTAAYSNGKTETVTSGFTFTPTVLNTAGTQKITVTYGGKTATFDVTVTSKEPEAAEDFAWTLENGVLTLSGHGLMPDYDDGKAPWYEKSNEIKKIVISKGIVSIGNYAFEQCSSLSSITIPDSVTSIGNGAFANCYSATLTSITIPESVTSIGNEAFVHCSFTTITIPKSVVSMGDYTFQWCNSLTTVTIPNSIMSIGNSVFLGCSSLKAITIPKSVKSIGDHAFNGCEKLASVTISDSVTIIGEGAFDGCHSLTTITIPKSVVSIGDGAFSNCIALTEISVDKNNPKYCSVGGVLFSKDKKTLITCPSGMTGSYSIPDSVTSIGDYAFAECYELSEITIPSNVTSIGDSAFLDCYSLVIITIPDSVTSIGEFAFGYCYSLAIITIPDSVTSIGDGAFTNCPNVMIQGHAGSYAEQYAKENDITFLVEPDSSIIENPKQPITEIDSLKPKEPMMQTLSPKSPRVSGSMYPEIASTSLSKDTQAHMRSSMQKTIKYRLLPSDAG